MSLVVVGRIWSANSSGRLLTYVMTRGRVLVSIQWSTGENVSNEGCVLVRQRSPLMAVHGSWRRTMSYFSVSARARAQSCADEFLPTLAWKILRPLCPRYLACGLLFICLGPGRDVGAS